MSVFILSSKLSLVHSQLLQKDVMNAKQNAQDHAEHKHMFKYKCNNFYGGIYGFDNFFYRA